MTLEPTPEQFQQLLAADDESPVVMINLLRFRKRADGSDGEQGLSGVEAYQRYGEGVAPFLERVGGRIRLAVQSGLAVIAPAGEHWDMVLAVEYPSRRAFVEMISDPGYLEVHHHRAAALEDSRLIACQWLDGADI